MNLRDGHRSPSSGGVSGRSPKKYAAIKYRKNNEMT
jgi:hypothetical protein